MYWNRHLERQTFEELRLHARTVFVLDREGVGRYIQIIKKVGDEPDYEAVLEAANNLI